MVRKVGTIVVTAILVSAFWIFYSNIRSGTIGGPSRSSIDRGQDTDGEIQGGEVQGVIVGPTGLVIPVAGVRPTELVDTYNQSRAGGARVHNAIDIMAPTGRPVVSATPGRVEKIFFSRGGGGNSVYVRSHDGRWIYYYAHLSAYAPGLREGQRLLSGAPIGYVGFSGNANPQGPHLHFAVHRMAPGERWHEGTAINPYPLLAGKPARG